MAPISEKNTHDIRCMCLIKVNSSLGVAAAQYILGHKEPSLRHHQTSIDYKTLAASGSQWIRSLLGQRRQVWGTESRSINKRIHGGEGVGWAEVMSSFLLLGYHSHRLDSASSPPLLLALVARAGLYSRRGREVSKNPLSWSLSLLPPSSS